MQNIIQVCGIDMEMYPSKFNKHLEKFKNIHKGQSGIFLAPGKSFTEEWDGPPNYSYYTDSVKATVNRMIYLNSRVANSVDYYFFGSEYNTHADWKQQIDEYCKRTPNIVKFASAYENGRSHKEINRGNIYQEQADKLGALCWENNLSMFSNDIANYAVFGHSITFPIMQFLLYMGCNPIYLVGCDGGLTAGDNSNNSHIMSLWKVFKIWKNIEYKDVEIVSINPVSLKDLFRNVYISSS